MTIAQSKLTAQGQISVPMEIRKRLGLAPGAVLEWRDDDGRIVVSKLARHTSLDVHEALFGQAVPKSPVDAKEGIRAYVRRRHARR